MEDLQKVCDLLTDTLRETRNLRKLKKLYYDKSTETVTAMISDIIKQVV